MELVIKNKLIDAPIETILKTLKSEIRTGKLKDIEAERNDIDLYLVLSPVASALTFMPSPVCAAAFRLCQV